MKAVNIAATVVGMLLKVACLIAIVYGIYRGALLCYDYGYRVFPEPAISAGTGRTVPVTITEETTAQQLGEQLEQKGLVRDGRVFVVQYYLSEFRKDIQPGTYELSTAMTAEEMMEFIAGSAIVEEEEV